jgi:hypothetical protein
MIGPIATASSSTDAQWLAGAGSAGVWAVPAPPAQPGWMAPPYR